MKQLENFSIFIIVLVFVILCIPAVSIAGDANEIEARRIMEGVFSRPTGQQLSGKATMVVKGADGKIRNTQFNVKAMNFEEGTRILIKFNAPSSAKGTNILTTDFDSASRIDDQWIYIPKLRKSTRIGQGNRSGSFMDSDLSFANITKANPEQYRYKLLKKSTFVGKQDCWLIEEIPVSKSTLSETGLSKSHHWVAKDSFVVLQTKSWANNTSKLKYMKFEDVKKVNDTYIIHKVSAQTQEKGKVLSATVVVFSELNLAHDQFTERDFSIRVLEQ